jgi:hypothetical protein
MNNTGDRYNDVNKKIKFCPKNTTGGLGLVFLKNITIDPNK